MNILFVGVGYFPWLTSGEKNFFWRLMPVLQEQVGITIFSVNDHSADQLMQDSGSQKVTVYCARRPFHRHHERFFFHSNGYTAYHHRHKPAQEIIEKFLTVLVKLPQIKRVVRQHNIDIIHFMDNFGPAMPFLRQMLRPVRITYSAANYEPRGRQSSYDAYLRWSMGYLDGVGVYTQAYLQKLQQLGVKSYMALTPWGVPVSTGSLSEAEKQIIREELDIPAQDYLVLWSGYLQQIQETDFYRTIQVARESLKQQENVTFVFAFKPETFRPEYGEQRNGRIRIINGIKNFGAVLETADLFLSPIGNQNSTVSPPLTWLEAMCKGTPVLTTAVGGVSEFITHKETGYVASNYETCPVVLLESLQTDSLNYVSRQAQTVIQQHYTMQQAARRYISFWEEVLKRTRNEPKRV